MERNLRRFARRILLWHLALLVAVLAVVFVASWGVYASARRQAQDQAQSQQALIVNQTSSGLKGYYDSIFSDLELFKPVSPDDEETEDRVPETEAGTPGKGLRGYRIPAMLLTQLNGRVAHLFMVEKGTYATRMDGKQATIPSVKELVDRNRAWIDSVDKPTISPLEEFEDRKNDMTRSFMLVGFPVRVNLKKTAVVVASVSSRATSHRFFDDVNRNNGSVALLLDESKTIIASSRPELIGMAVGGKSDPRLLAAMASFNAKGNEGTESIPTHFLIAQERFAPAMLTAQRVAVLDKQWVVIVASPLSEIDVVVQHIFGAAIFWSAVVALAMTAILVSTAVQIIRSRARIERERHQLLEREVKQAREIQLAWLPRKPVQSPSLDIATINQPASRISGDFYNWFELPDGRTAVVIGDVTGHGMSAAFLMATTQLLVRNTLPNVRDPGRCLEEINRQLCTQVFSGQFVTLQILVIDPTNNQFEIATGGHPPPMLGDEDGLRPLNLEPNLVLGVEKDSPYSTEIFELSPHSTLILYTDGLPDIISPTGDRFGMSRAKAVMDQPYESSQAMITAVLSALDTFRKGTPLSDDLTLVAIQFQGREVAESAPSVHRHPVGIHAPQS